MPNQYFLYFASVGQPGVSLVNQDLESLIERVADHTIERDMEDEDWEKAVAINGLLATGQEPYVEAARQLVDRSIATQTSEGKLSYGTLHPTSVMRFGSEAAEGIRESAMEWQRTPTHASTTFNCAAIGNGVVAFYERTGDDDYLEAARKQYDFLTSVSRTNDGGIPIKKVERFGSKELWVDGMYMMCPFMARYGDAAGDDTAIDEAVRQATVHAKRLQDPHTGLFRHVWQEQPNTFLQPTFWARGNGWAAAAILDVLQYLPAAHPGRDDLIETFRTHAAALVDQQDDSGFWHNIIDDPETMPETSGTLMFAYAFKRAREMGLLEDDRYEAAAEDALSACCGVVTDEGAVRRVAVPPGGPGSVPGVTSFGQGWFLLAASRFA